VAALACLGTAFTGQAVAAPRASHAIPPEALASPQAAAAQSRVVFETLTYHFSSSQSLLPWTTRDWYPRYFAKADVVGFDLYPVS